MNRWHISEAATNDRSVDITTRVDAVWEPDAAFLGHCPALLERDSAGAAAAQTPAAPAAAGRGHAAHTHLETTTRQVSVRLIRVHCRIYRESIL